MMNTIRIGLVIGLFAAVAAVPGAAAAQVQSSVLLNEAPGSDDMGFAVAMSDEWLFAGDPGDRADGRNGVAFVYKRVGSGQGVTWARVQTVSPSNTGASWRFGAAVAVSGNVAVVGDPEAQVSGGPDREGAATVYRWSGTNWNREATLVSPTPSAHGDFGTAVAIDGDTIVVGAPNEDASGVSRAGAAHVFGRSGSTWNLITSISDPAAETIDRFGSAVAVSGSTALAGAPYSDTVFGPPESQTRIPYTGQVLSYTLSAGRATLDQRISNGVANERVGWSLSMDGHRFLAGAPFGNTAYLFARSGPTAMFQVAKTFTPSIPADPSVNRYGTAVSLRGRRAAIGDPASRLNRTDDGLAYSYIERSNGWIEKAILAGANTSYAASGTAVAVFGPYAAVGAPGISFPNDIAGAVYTYVDADVSPPTVAFAPRPPSATSSDTVEYGVTASDNVTPAADLKIFCRIDTQPYERCEGSHRHLSVSEGPHTVSIYAEDEAGLRGAIATASVHVDSTKPTIVVHMDPQPNAHGWNRTQVTLTSECSDGNGSGIKSCPGVHYGVPDSNLDVTFTAEDNAGNKGSTIARVRVDSTPPLMNAYPYNPANANGWHREDVMFLFACSDQLSGVAFCPGPAWVAHEGIHTLSAPLVTDRAGNVATFTPPTVRIDRTPPVLSDVTTTPTPTEDGWHNTSKVTIRWTCTDALSGAAVAQPSREESFSPLGSTERWVQISCSDRAGNVTSRQVNLKVDLWAPTVSMNQPPAMLDGNQLTGSASDGLSGIKRVIVIADNTLDSAPGTLLTATCPSVCKFDWQWTVSTASLPPGAYSFVAYAVDRAGNPSQQTPPRIAFKL